MLLLQMEKTYARGRGQKLFGTRWCGTVTLGLLKAFGFPSVACVGQTMGRSNRKAPHAKHRQFYMDLEGLNLPIAFFTFCAELHFLSP